MLKQFKSFIYRQASFQIIYSYLFIIFNTLHYIYHILTVLVEGERWWCVQNNLSGGPGFLSACCHHIFATQAQPLLHGLDCIDGVHAFKELIIAGIVSISRLTVRVGAAGRCRAAESSRLSRPVHCGLCARGSCCTGIWRIWGVRQVCCSSSAGLCASLCTILRL